MCGLGGVLTSDGADEREARDGLVRMLAEGLAHRGPDAQGLFESGPCTLVHRRLSIIDLSDQATQPLTTEDRSLAVVVNGEIYNYLALRDELRKKGFVFRSESDSEVVLHGYRAWGEGVIARLDGMFAIALYDAQTRTLLLARDRAGKKPLVYARDGKRFVFSSEIRPLYAALKACSKAPAIDYDAIDAYLTLQYVPGPKTAFEGVRKLPPATYAIVKPGRDPVLTTYWSLPNGPSLSADTASLATELQDRLKIAVSRRLMSDVPLGAFLSGGIDSGTVVALMAQASTARVKTFSIGFQEGDPELAFAKLVAARYGTDHHEAIVTPQMTDVLPKLVQHYGEPFADSSAVATYYLAQYTRKSVTVALSGDAGDEMLGGYKRYAVARMGHLYDMLPEMTKQPLSRLGSLVLGVGSAAYGSYARRAEAGEATRYLELVRFLTEDDKNRLYLGPLLAARSHDEVRLFDEHLARARSVHHFGRILRLDFATYLPDDILTKVDIASMAHALEVRCPFLDTDVMEFCARLPPSALARIRGKYILRLATKNLLPDSIRRRTKRGFALPLERWMFRDLKPLAEDTLLSKNAHLREIISQEGVRALFKQGGVGSKAADKLWALLFLELWLRSL